MTLSLGSLFTGIGGFDLGLEHAGFSVSWQCERDRFCRELLARHWPETRRYATVQEIAHEGAEAVDLLCGGDPCPVRSRARGSRPSSHPDLSGYFLAVAGRLRPRWVLRENVPAPDALDFCLGLEILGYRSVAVELDARDFTGQSRRRQFCLGCPPTRATRLPRALLDACDGTRITATRSWEEAPITACLTSHGGRLCAEDTYCFEPGRGLRYLSPDERDALTGLPRGWTAGFSNHRRALMTGNAVVVPVAEWIGRRIMEAEQ